MGVGSSEGDERNVSESTVVNACLSPLNTTEPHALSSQLYISCISMKVFFKALIEY